MRLLEIYCILKHKKDNHIKDNRIIDFFHGVRAYFMESCTYMVTKLPLNDELLAHCEVVDVGMQSSANERSIEHFFDRFPCLLNHSKKTLSWNNLLSIKLKTYTHVLRKGLMKTGSKLVR